MNSLNLITEPFSHPIGDDNISATIRLEQPADVWAVTVVIQRAPDQRAIDGQAVSAQLFDENGVPLKLVRRASGPLAEAGGSLGTSANAIFQFQGSQSLPLELRVTYQGLTVTFRIVNANQRER